MIRAIAMNTFLEAVRDRIWVILILFGFVLLVGNHVLTPIALGEGPRVTIDLGLGALNLLGLLVTIIVGANLVHQEIDRRSIHVILARPVGRTSYLIGKWLGLCGMLWSTALVMGLGLTVVGWQIRGAEIVVPLLQATFLACLSFSILCTLVILFSSLSTPLLSTLYSLGIYCMGWWVADLRSLGEKLGEPLQTLVLSASFVLPNLELFNARFAVAHMEAMPWLQIGIAAGYALFYSAAVLALSTMAFQAREFK
jgi:ABC-type transport system involved in multi-copper enzyme maturation permease subunit